ncbi:PilN family type IVB pilus formation outer membrane protein [Luteimonas sp. MHLX1A]|uniref:PilN family type IVB pilus formation outer membrane protein n=1 Tax=Alterluteimonas muca TaxID=2878684 RepID=UPI001E626B31|nr:PilN family type IVB pilus formation outer membrane protein [Luteimonas sp. MHLX1A]MCD9046765.1 PilN family type IVB pilus formation outer membrane protein [Luteimonas sp. MHLX1A]
MRMFLLAASLTLALGACASQPRPVMDGLGVVDHDVVQARAALHQRTERATVAFESINDIWLGAVPVQRGEAEPAVLASEVKFVRIYPVTLHELANYITQNFDVPVSVSEDALQAAVAAAGETISPMALGGGMSMPGEAGPIPSPMAAMAGQGAPQMRTGMNRGAGAGLNINYTGSLRGFLDTIAAQSGTSWRYAKGGIEMFALDTRVFQVDILPAPSAVQAEISNQSQGGAQSMGGGSGGGMGGESGSTQIGGSSSTASSIEIDPFTALVDAVTGMLSSQGNVTATAPLGQIVVTDRPAILDRVSSYVDQANSIAKRQVALEVRVFTVEGKRSNGHAVSWDLVWSSLSSRAGVNLIGGGPSTDGPGLGVTILDSDSPFSGSRLFLDALAEQGNARQLTSATALTLSGRPVPFQVTEEIGYLESSEISLVPDVGVQTTINPGRTTTGFTMTLLPVLSGNDVMMQATISLRSLREMRRLGSDQQGNTYETPLTDLRQVMQHLNLKSGQTAIMTGFEQETLRSNATGVGSPRFRLLGGSKLDEERSSSLVIMITPKVVS